MILEKEKIILNLGMNSTLLSPVTTNLSWNDLKLHAETLQQVNEIKNRLKDASQFNTSGSKTKLKATGNVVLFHGPAGTGKTLTAALLGKEFNKPVYKVDLSKLVSKYIGETEKNLHAVFTDAENAGAILFFDEADALFGKRTGVKDAHDRFANIEASYLLEQIEARRGLTILATNKRSNIDDAFIRRLRFVISFL
jgi:SpoVK/Ycf46/Vps4 family AAA+-type ATPase